MRLYENLHDFEDYHQFLQVFSEFQFETSKDQEKKFDFQYDSSGDSLKILRDKYNLNQVVGKGTTFRKLVHLMIWVNDQLIGDGNCTPIRPLNSLSILQKTKSQQIHSNCFMYAVVLNEVFLSMGFYSRMVRCMPMDLSFHDCHCVTTVYIPEYNKWVVFDAANRAYYLDETMTPMSLMELRNHLLQQKKIYIPMMSRFKIKDLCNYWIKNIIRFECYQLSCFGSEDRQGERVLYHLQPQNFSISDKTVKFDSFCLVHKHTSNIEKFWVCPDKTEA